MLALARGREDDVSICKVPATIQSASLRFMDRVDLLSAEMWVVFPEANTSRFIAGYALSTVDSAGRDVGGPLAIDFIIRLMRVCGVSKWEDLPGQQVYVLSEGEPAYAAVASQWSSKVIGLERVTYPDQRFLFTEWQDQVRAALKHSRQHIVELMRKDGIEEDLVKLVDVPASPDDGHPVQERSRT